MSVFEALMLISFGVAWPVSIYKSLLSRSTKGKSFLFMLIVLFGYASGIIHKVFFNLDWVLALYILNFVMVAIDVALYVRNRKEEKEREAKAGQQEF